MTAVECSVLSDMIRNILHDMVQVLGSYANVEEPERLLNVIECTTFASIPDDLLSQVEVRSLEPSRRGIDGDYLFYNPHNGRDLTYDEVWNFFCALCDRSQTAH